ncbi:hypothetical protein F2Q68_00046262 [Brassica cretica]|uniref:SUI1 domain-containing protein n=1 Tax=Brassica cretica TaxID=69181 RepID=A0A8S9LTE8_BRACR|nr:hypothetical protein F2Q68_00046262 [Brassica cretica]
MFKKAVEAKSHQRLSGADRKKLRRTVQNRFSLLTDELLDAILPPKVEITVSKFQNRVLVYSIEGGCPMFFDIDGRGNEILPTVFALWEAPEMLPSFMLKGGEVSRYVLGGADLMFPGILIPPEGFPSFSAGEIWSVKVPGNAAPIAVGFTTMSSAEGIKAGLRGKALRIAHYYRDFLWESAEGHYVPNAGFWEDVVMEDPAFLASEKKKAEISESSVASSTAQAQSDKMLEIIEVYKPSIHNSAIFASLGEDKGKLYTASEASDVVFKYIEKENLVKPTNKSMVVLDPILCDALFKGAIKKGSAYPSEIHKKDVGSTFIGRMQPHQVVMRGGCEPVVRKGGIKPLQIMTERRQGNKKVTKVSGIETFLMDPDSFGSELQKKFACSTSVNELPGKKGYEVLIQGGVIEDVARYMVEHYGVPKRYIEVLDKTRK